MTSVSGNVENLEPLCIAARNTKWCRHFGNSRAAPHKIKHTITICSIDSISGYIPPKVTAGPQTDVCTHMFIAALLTIAKKQKQLASITDAWTTCGISIQ